MKTVLEQLCDYGAKASTLGLCAGTGGNISARDGDVIWMKPAGYSMDELTPELLPGLDLTSGTQVHGETAPTSEYDMHLSVYRVRPDVTSVFHMHPPWLTGIISAGVPFRPLTTESVGYLGRVIHLPYEVPQSSMLAAQVRDAVRDHDTLLLPNHGLVTVGQDPREAYHRSLVAEDTAKSILAAAIVGTPQFLSDEQVCTLLAGEAG
ncbi:MAG: class II aldolase/adducin family protein [Verrucomicrobia bacterium]|jgi:L-fuculose-phosphate aldolase|nr:class II aldolase/adducin family protein [Verrucomicrobiota bacterium]